MDGIFHDEASRIKEFLKKNSRGMNIREISDALQINRNSVAKYLDVLTTRDEVEVKIFGKSKVYFLSQRVPISTLMRFSSHLLLILNRDLLVVQINDAFLRFMGKTREAVLGMRAGDLHCDLLTNETVVSGCAECLQGTETSNEISITGDPSPQHFRTVLTPTLFPDNTSGIILFFENITEKKQIASALVESEENFKTLVEGTGDGCVIIDDKGVVIAWNRALEQITGIPSSESIGINIADVMCRLLVPDRNSKKHIEHLKATFESNIQIKVFPLRDIPDEIQIARTDGQHRYIQKFAVPIWIEKKMHFSVIIRDISKRKLAEEALKRERTLLAGLLDSIPDLVFFKDPNGIYLGCNAEFARHIGRSRNYIIGHTDSDLYPAEIARVFLENDALMIRSGMPRHNEEWLDYPDGRRILVDTLKSPLISTDGAPLGILGISRDITERKNAEDLIRKSEEKYRRFIETANEGICAVDRNFLVTFANQKLADMLGWSVEEIIGSHISASMHPDEQADITARMQNRLMGTKEVYERRFRKNDGSTCWMLVSVTPLIGADGTFEGSFAMLTDITERKEAERILKESEERFRHLVDYVPGLAVQGYYMDGKTFYWNHASELLYGYTAGEAIGRNLIDLIIPPEMRDSVKGAIAGMAESGQPIPSADLSLMRKNGTRVEVFSGHAIVQVGGKPAQLFCMDIDLSERRQAELSIRQSEERFEQVANNSDEWIWEVDADGMYRYCSAAVERIIGYTPEEIVGKLHYYDLFPPESREELIKVTVAAFASHEPFRHFVNPALHKNGSTVLLETSGSAIFDSQGTFIGYRGCDTDVTERRNMDIARQEALQQIEMNIGQLAMLGDYLRNPLTAILSYAGMGSPDMEEKIEKQVKEIDRIISRIDQGWVESEKVRSHLRRYYDISLPDKPAHAPDTPTGSQTHGTGKP